MRPGCTKCAPPGLAGAASRGLAQSTPEVAQPGEVTMLENLKAAKDKLDEEERELEDIIHIRRVELLHQIKTLDRRYQAWQGDERKKAQQQLNHLLMK